MLCQHMSCQENERIICDLLRTENKTNNDITATGTPFRWCSRRESEWGEKHPKEDSGMNQREYKIQQKREI